MKKNVSAGFITPSGMSRSADGAGHKRWELYRKEKELLKEEFKSFGKVFDWGDPKMQKKLKAIARQVIESVAIEVTQKDDLISLIMPVEPLEPGDTFVSRELHGAAVYYGTYGAAVRMSRPQFTQYTATTNLKEVGFELDLTSIRTGRYSPSELATYVADLIQAWRNKLLFDTMGALSVYSSAGAQYIDGTPFAQGTMETALAALNDDAEPKLIVGRRNAIVKLSTFSAYSDVAKREFETQGQVGAWGGIPVLKVNSFTDPDYGNVYPLSSTSLWMFSEAPVGIMAQADALRTADEIKLQNEVMNLYFRWDDGFGIWRTGRAVHIDLS